MKKHCFTLLRRTSAVQAADTHTFFACFKSSLFMLYNFWCLYKEAVDGKDNKQIRH